MKKLLQTTSIVALILMSTQAFASDINNSVSTPQMTTVSMVVPAPAVQANSISMADLALPGADHDIFEAIYRDVQVKIFARTGAGSKDYSIIEFINKIKAQRLYNPASWNEFQKRTFAHDPNDINMVSKEQQLANIKAIFYKSFLEKTPTHKHIIELQAVGAADPRSVDQIIFSMSNKGTANAVQSNPLQGMVNGMMNKR
ncbi:MAG: hypothetical protein ACRYGR_10255 [Janthinobacterium lividum]